MNKSDRRPTRLLTNLLAATLLGLSVFLAGTLQSARADDLDIYTNPAVLPNQAPLTALALDLNITSPGNVVCDNVLLSSDAACIDLRGKLTVTQLFNVLGVPVPLLAGLNPLALLSDLSSSVRILLANTLTLLNPNLLQINNQLAYVLAIQDILQALVNSRLAIFVNHANKGPAPSNVCAFADKSSLPAPRQDTLACSNGSYVFLGLANLANPLELTSTVTKVVSGLTGTVSGVLTGGGVGITIPADSPFQAKEIYAEFVKYLRGDPIFNGHLGYFDYGDINPTTNLDSSQPLLSWDPGVETSDHKNYRGALKDFPEACTINLVHLQLTNATAQDDSDADLKALFPYADANNDNTLTLPEVVESAASDGFVYNGKDVRLINSYFVVQDNLGDAVSLQNLGFNVSTYTNLLGLIGRGQSIASSLIKTLSVDASVSSLSVAGSRTSATGITTAAYLPVFRPTPDQKPDWPGNLKRLKLASDGQGGLELQDAAGKSAIAGDGRIRTSALTIWTDGSQLGSGKSADGRKADLGGAGQRIPGYVFGGGGNPGRSNPASGTGSRKLFYDSYDVFGNGASLNALSPDDSAVRAELLTPTGATAYSPPTTACELACAATGSTCGLLCSTTKATSDTLCATTATTCSTTCATTATACNLLCLPGTLGNACRTTCSNNQTACDATCTTNKNSCLATSTAAFNTCSANCGSTQASCVSACGSNGRTADTVTRELLLYARGYNVGTLASPTGNGPTSSPTNTGISGRPWMMGAVLHSRPLAINYGRPGGASSDQVRVVFGSADGYLRMVNDSNGAENWAFMPQAVMGQLKTLRENQAGATLPYGVDGSPVSLIRDRGATGSGQLGTIGDNSEDRVLLFFGLRRGGSRYYALNITDPDNPTLLWSIGPDGLRRAGQAGVVSGSAAQFASLGLSFSTPQIGRIQYDADGNSNTTNDITSRSVLIFGGGYNGGRTSSGTKIGKDFNNSRNVLATAQVGQDDGSGSTDRGNAIFMVDAETGALIWRGVRASSAGYNASGLSYGNPLLVDSVASDVTAVDTNNDGYTDRVYFGDTGGRLWRADLPGSDRSAWTLTPLASVGRHADSSSPPALANDRRIFHAPDYVPVRLRENAYDIIVFGTGDREDPFNLVTENWLYAYRDTDVISGKTSGEIITTEAGLAGAKHSAFRDQTSTCSSSGTTSSSCQDVRLLDPGYRLKLKNKGEKLFSAPLSLGGVVSFSTFVPPDPSDPSNSLCVPQEGAGRLYSISLRDSRPNPYINQVGADRDSKLPAPGLPGELTAVSRGTQAASSSLIEQKVPPSQRASWRERLGEEEKALPP